MSAFDRKRVAKRLLAIIRQTNDVRATRASLLFARFVSESDATQVFDLLDHPNDTMRNNLKEWLFDTFKGQGADSLAAVARRSELARPVQQRIVSEFKNFLVDKDSVPVLFAYIPNLRDFKPRANQVIVRNAR